MIQDKDIKKKYTKKQITEVIAYWKKQMEKGNYRKVNESRRAELWDYER